MLGGSWFNTSPNAGARSFGARSKSVRREASGQTTPAQILSFLRDSGEFHLGKFKHSYAFDGTILGQGTFGCVRRCFSTHTQNGGSTRFFAAKEINYAELKSSEVSDIMSEVYCLRSLNHQHIVHLKEAWLEGARVTLVEELLEGSDGFTAVLASGPLSEDEAKNVMWQLASAVAYCHGKRIVHRDIKLENIMLVNGGTHVKLVDFGLATVLTNPSEVQVNGDSSDGGGDGGDGGDGKTAGTSSLNGVGNVVSGLASTSGVANAAPAIKAGKQHRNDKCVLDQQLTRFCGTPHYMAPEIAKRVPYGRPVDVWSMGVLLYIFLSAETVWEDNGPKEVVAAIKKGAWSFEQAKELWQGRSQAAKDLITAMLDRNPSTRVTAFSVCCSDWLHSTAASTSRASSRPSPLAGTSRRNVGSLSSSSSSSSLSNSSGSNGGIASSSGIAGSGSQTMIYSQAEVSSPTLAMSEAQAARLNLLAKREYLHHHVSQLVNFCSATHSGERGTQLQRTRQTLTSLLETAMRMARRITHADLATLFIVVPDNTASSSSSSSSSSSHSGGGSGGRNNSGGDGGGGGGGGGAHLWSKVSQSGVAIRVDLDSHSLCGHVAVTGDCLNVRDAYQDSRFDQSHDQRTGYRTHSVLCAPIPHGHPDNLSLIGVVEMINKHAPSAEGGGAVRTGPPQKSASQSKSPRSLFKSSSSEGRALEDGDQDGDESGQEMEAVPFSEEDGELLQDLCVHLGLALTRLLGQIGDHTTRELFASDDDNDSGDGDGDGGDSGEGDGDGGVGGAHSFLVPIVTDVNQGEWCKKHHHDEDEDEDEAVVGGSDERESSAASKAAAAVARARKRARVQEESVALPPPQARQDTASAPPPQPPAKRSSPSVASHYYYPHANHHHGDNLPVPAPEVRHGSSRGAGDGVGAGGSGEGRPNTWLQQGQQRLRTRSHTVGGYVGERQVGSPAATPQAQNRAGGFSSCAVS